MADTHQRSFVLLVAVLGMLVRGDVRKCCDGKSNLFKQHSVPLWFFDLQWRNRHKISAHLLPFTRYPPPRVSGNMNFALLHNSLQPVCPSFHYITVHSSEICSECIKHIKSCMCLTDSKTFENGFYNRNTNMKSEWHVITYTWPRSSASPVVQSGKHTRTFHWSCRWSSPSYKTRQMEDVRTFCNTLAILTLTAQPQPQ